MGEIYSNAAVVYSWLGQASSAIELACTAIHQVYNAPPRECSTYPDLHRVVATLDLDETHPPDNFERLLKSTKALLSVQYFERV